MREIKFRAWWKPTKTIYKVGQVTLEKGTWNYEPENRENIGVCILYQPSFILMQYTGLHDKNGVEIYEGDIVKLHYIKNGLAEITAVVAYHEDYAQYVITDTKYATDDYEPLSDYEDFEVIGNIYENKDLIED